MVVGSSRRKLDPTPRWRAWSRLIRAAAAEAGLRLGSVPLVQQISACLANADMPIEEQWLTAAFEARGWAESVYVTNDTFALLRSGVDEPRGVAVVCGAGINCSGMLPDGRTARFPALGKLTGDWGGGAQLAEEAFWSASRADDGRGPATALLTALPAHFGLPSLAALIEAFHFGELPAESRQLEAAPVLFEVAAAGDVVALGIIQQQAEEIVAMALSALRRLELLGEPVQWSSVAACSPADTRSCSIASYACWRRRHRRRSRGWSTYRPSSVRLCWDSTTPPPDPRPRPGCGPPSSSGWLEKGLGRGVIMIT